MAQTTPPTITPAPAQPQRNVKATFSTLIDAFVTWLINAVAQFGALATNVYNNAVDAYNSALASASSAALSSTYANTATSAAAAALATANAVPWQSGVVVAQDACVIAPADRRTYRRKTASSSSTTDPSLDQTNYVLVSFGPVPYLHVREEQAPGTQGGASTAGSAVTRTLNTVKVNTIPGASLSSNQVTLPAGTYEVYGRAPAYNSGDHRASLAASSGALLTGSNASSLSTQTDSTFMGQLTLASAQTVWVSHLTNGGQSGNGLGRSALSGIEIYTEVIFRKVA